MTDIQAIETEYDGYRFRSRQEARWAVFFNALGVEFQYEPQGFELEDGERYLPDFYLPNITFRTTDGGGIWVEVKGILTQKPNKADVFDTLEKFTKAKDEPVALLVGRITNHTDGWDMEGNTVFEIKHDHQYGLSIDYPMIWVKCGHCGKIKLEFPEGNYMTCERCGGSMNGYSNISADIQFAMEQANKARFEHGEKPNV